MLLSKVWHELRRFAACYKITQGVLLSALSKLQIRRDWYLGEGSAGEGAADLSSLELEVLFETISIVTLEWAYTGKLTISTILA